MPQSFSHQLGKVTLEIRRGDIARQPDLQAVVNAANAQLQTGGGVAGALHRAAGPELARAGAPHAPIKPGQAVVTPGFDLPNDKVIHVLGPVYGRDKPEDKILADCYRNALQIAERENLESVGFPAISTGAFGYPLRDAAIVTAREFQKSLPSLQNVKLVRLVLFSQDQETVFTEVFQNQIT